MMGMKYLECFKLSEERIILGYGKYRRMLEGENVSIRTALRAIIKRKKIEFDPQVSKIVLACLIKSLFLKCWQKGLFLSGWAMPTQYMAMHEKEVQKMFELKDA